MTGVRHGGGVRTWTIGMVLVTAFAAAGVQGGAATAEEDRATDEVGSVGATASGADAQVLAGAAEADSAAAAQVAARASWATRTSGLLVTTDVLDDPATVAARASELLGVGVTVDRPLDGSTHLLALADDVTLDEVERATDQLEVEGLAVDADPDLRIFTTAVPDDPEFERQWNLRGRYGSQALLGIRVEEAWQRQMGSNDVVVSVLDTGILPHPDLHGRTVAGYNVVEGTTQTTDRGVDCVPEPGQPRPPAPTWHGLHVAGIIGASTHNGIGIAGVDQRARIQPVRVLSDCGGTVSDLIDGIRWAAGLSVTGAPDNATPADVINLSLGGVAPVCPRPLREAVRAATERGGPGGRGTIVVAAVGNEDHDLSRSAFVPASCEGTIAVSATSPRGDRAGLQAGMDRRPYANHGSRVDLSAPGGDTSFGDWGAILSLSADSGYSYKAGTSMAAPQVAGVAALLRARDRAIRPAEVRRLLMATSQPFPLDTPGAVWRCGSAVIRCGAGVLDAGAALSARIPAAPRFSDGKGAHADGIAWMAAEGVTLGCTTDGRRFCANDPVTRGQMATFIARALYLTEGREARFDDVGAGSTHGPAIDALRRERVTEGCWSQGGSATYCPDDPVSREEMASFIRRAERYRAGSAVRFVDVDPAGTHAGAVGAMYREGVTNGCGTRGDRFCPNDPVTRGQMASFLHRALG